MREPRMCYIMKLWKLFLKNYKKKIVDLSNKVVSLDENRKLMQNKLEIAKR